MGGVDKIPLTLPPLTEKIAALPALTENSADKSVLATTPVTGILAPPACCE